MDSLLELAHERLAIQGGRMTAQRRFILQALESFEGHPTAEELYDCARQSDPSLNLSTIYRTLRWLEQEGLVRPRRFTGDQHHEHFDAATPQEHHHFYCNSCQQVIEFEEPAIQAIKKHFSEHSGAFIASASVILYGICPECRSVQQSNGA